MMSPETFKSYVCTQRKIRWEYLCDVNGIKALPGMRKTKDGNWLNIAKYSAEGYCLKKAEYIPACNSKTFLEKELAKIRLVKNHIKKRICTLCNSQMKILSWKANELEWLSNSIEEIKPVEDLLLELSSNITSEGTKLYCLSEAKKIEDTRIARRKRENKAKTEKEKAVRLLNSSCPGLNLICRNGKELSEKVEKGDYGTLVMKEDLIQEHFANLTPKLHSRGLRNLKENGIFAGGILGVIEMLISDLDIKMENARKRSLGMKERKAEKIKEAKKQRTLNNIFK